MELKNVVVRYDKINNMVHLDCSRKDIIPMYAYYLFQALGIPDSVKISFLDYRCDDTLEYIVKSGGSKF